MVFSLLARLARRLLERIWMTERRNFLHPNVKAEKIHFLNAKVTSKNLSLGRY